MEEDTLLESRILVVDDEEMNTRALERLLRREGYVNVRATTDSRRALGLFLELAPDVVVLDLHMPHVDGFGVMRELTTHLDPEAHVPVLVVTGDTDQAIRQRALAAGAHDFVTKPFEPVELLLRIRNLLETRHLHLSLRKHAARLEERVAERTRELEETRLEILQRLAIAAEYRDDITGRHAERVGILSARIVRRLEMDDDVVELVRRAAPLHDVGKIGIPDRILLKPGPLTPTEFEVMKKHVTIGARILSGSDYPLLRMAREIALTHHERWDGGGYMGLEGPEAPLVGRAVAVADAFDSLTHDRPYKAAVPVPEAVRRIVGDCGTHFDPGAVEAFRSLVEDGGLDGAVLDPVPRPGAAGHRTHLSSRRPSAPGPTPASH